MIDCVVLGAGRSSIYAIKEMADYLKNKGNVIVADRDFTQIASLAGSHDNIEFRKSDLLNSNQIKSLLNNVKVAISLLPPAMHIAVAKICIELKVHLVTASYLSPEMRSMDELAKENGLIFLNEMGLDPGIDHMSAMKLIHDIQSKGGQILSFESYCGGLVTDASDSDNPWRYKFSWNPGNVVMAGQGGPAIYLRNGKPAIIPYQSLFARHQIINIPGIGAMEAYANRNSLGYIKEYGLEGIQKLLRGTFRKKGFCEAWQVLVQLGMTDNSTTCDFSNFDDLSDWTGSFLPEGNSGLEKRIKEYTNCTDDTIDKLRYLDLFSDKSAPLQNGTAANVLEKLLGEKWKLQPEDHDLVVMRHVINYKTSEGTFTTTSDMKLEGTDSTFTAMAKTVGLPLAFAAVRIIEGKYTRTGVQIPIQAELYIPVLEELSKCGIHFQEVTVAN